MKTEGVTRFSVSLPKQLASLFDRLVQEKGYANRSLAVADLIRDRLVTHQQESKDAVIAGTVTLVYDHHHHGLQEALTDCQHEHHESIISTLHVHLDHHNCLEVLVVKGKAAQIERMADKLIAAKGIKHGKLTLSTTGKDLPD